MVEEKKGFAVGSEDVKFKEETGLDVRGLLGTRQVVNEMAYRLLRTIPSGGRGYTMEQALTVAQLSVMMRLNPFNGEVYLMTDKEGVTKGAGIGIKGLRQCARRELRKASQLEHYSTKFRELEPSQYGLGAGWIAAECTLRDSVSEKAWWTNVFQIHASFQDMKLAEIQDMIGPPPVWIGLGFYQMNPNVDSLSFSMKPIQRVHKRAEADAIKQRFGVDLPFDDESDSDNGGAYEMGDVVEVSGMKDVDEMFPRLDTPPVDDVPVVEREAATLPKQSVLLPREEVVLRETSEEREARLVGELMGTHKKPAGKK